jgi:hypothetical protein
MRIGLVTVAGLLGALHLWVGIRFLLSVDDIAKALAIAKDGGLEVVQRLDLKVWRSNAVFAASVSATLGVAGLLSSFLIAVRWTWAWMVWLAVISVTAAYHTLWVAADFGYYGTLSLGDVTVTAAIVLLCVASWMYLTRASARAALLSSSV